MAAAATKKKIVLGNSCAYCGADDDTNNAKMKACSRCKVVFYCDKICQAADWKKPNGHQGRCISPSERKPGTIIQSASGSTTEDKTNVCAICLEITKSEFCILPCSHIYHNACISELRCYAENPTCPLCRKDIPSGPEQLFMEACLLRHNIYSKNEIHVSWNDRFISIEDKIKIANSLSTQDKENMKRVLKLLIEASEQGLAQAQAQLGNYYCVFEYNYELGAKWYRKAADQGELFAICGLSSLLYSGEGVPQNKIEALKYCELGGAQGDQHCQFNAGILYRDKGQTKDAFKWFKMAADSGHDMSQFSLGILYRDGNGVEQDFNKAYEYLEKASLQGHVAAMSCLGELCAASHTGKYNLKFAYHWLKLAAEQDHLDAQYSLAGMYQRGDTLDGKVHMKDAVRWYRKAASQGHYLSQVALTSCGLDHKEIAKWGSMAAAKSKDKNMQSLVGFSYSLIMPPTESNFRESHKWLLLAANQGVAQAQSQVGCQFYDGEGVKRDYKKSVYWFNKAADQNVPQACFNMSRVYGLGKGVKENKKEASKWLLKAGVLGYSKAFFPLAVAYSQNDLGFETDQYKAAKWYLKSAEDGNSDAMFEIAMRYANGNGLKKDGNLMTVWMRQAVKNGNVKAAQMGFGALFDEYDESKKKLED